MILLIMYYALGSVVLSTILAKRATDPNLLLNALT